jgi:hypothetical protein
VKSQGSYLLGRWGEMSLLFFFPLPAIGHGTTTFSFVIPHVFLQNSGSELGELFSVVRCRTGVPAEAGITAWSCLRPEEPSESEAKAEALLLLEAYSGR